MKYIESPDFYLYSPAVVGDTSITLNNFVDIYGNVLTISDFDTTGFGRIDPSGEDISESISFSGITANADGTYTLTGVKTVLAKSPYTQTSGLVRSHSINAIVRLSNTAGFYHQMFAENITHWGDDTNTDKRFIWDTGEVGDLDPEIKYDSATNQLKFRRRGETSLTEIPLSLRGTYANYASLPTDGSDGDIAITTDDYKLYVYDLGTTTWSLAGGSSGAGTMYVTELLGSESDAGDLKTFTLTAGSWPSTNFLMVYKNGQLQRIGVANDYTEVDSNTIQFTYTLAVDDLVSMVVVSIDLYNPAWGLVNASIIPDTTASYDLGSTSKKFKNIFLTGDLSVASASKITVASQTPTASLIPIADTNNKLDDLWLETYNVPTKAMNAGETIAGATLPVAVYQNKTDNEFYACDANDILKMKFLGFAITDGTDANPINVQFTGVVSGFTGLSEGEKYYVQDNKTIGTTVGTYEVLVGVAISTTELLIQKGARYASGVLALTATGSTTITTGFRISKVNVQSITNDNYYSNGGWTVFSGNNCVLRGLGVSTVAVAWKVGTDTAYHSGVIDTVIDRAFNLNNTKTNAPANSYLYWEAIGEL